MLSSKYFLEYREKYSLFLNLRSIQNATIVFLKSLSEAKVGGRASLHPQTNVAHVWEKRDFTK